MKKFILSFYLFLFVSKMIFAQQEVSNIFGFATSNTFTYCDLNDTNFFNKVVRLNPMLLRFPGGAVGNYYHFGGSGYGFDFEEYISNWNETSTFLLQVESVEGVNQIDELPETLAKQVREFKSNTYPLKQELRHIRQEMRSEIHSLFILITIINLVAGPVLAIVLYLTASRMRFFRYRK